MPTSATLRDGTARDEVDQKLRESEERFRAMADGCPSILWATGAGGELEFINEAYREYFGVPCEDIGVNRWQLPLHPEDSEAIEAVRRGTSDLVLMDCEMPEMNGYEATHHIRQGTQKHIPIVALTANAMLSDRERCLKAGMDDDLAKPVDPSRLASILAK